MTLYAVTVVIFFCLAAGWYGRRLWQAGQDVTAAKARLAGAVTARWAALRIAAVVAFAVVIAADFWIRRHGG